MAQRDDLGDRMKGYEAVETSRRFSGELPVYARIDGRGFSRFTKNMQRPFDPKMTQTMIDVTKHLVSNTHAEIGYVQSDEISLVWSGGKLFFDGKIQKSCSVLAGMATAAFAVSYADNFGNMSRDMPHFDCRVLELPSMVEAANMLLWRAMDARKNAVSMAARAYFGHSILQGKTTAEMMDMLQSVDAGMSTYPREFRYGTWLRRQTEERTFTAEELAAIPADYRPPADLVVTRSHVKVLDMPPFVQVTNRVGVVFNGETPA